MKENRLKVFEIALMLALSFTMCVGVWADSEQSELAGKLIRFHVIADSDSEEEQAVKLEVRDSVLEYLSPLLEGTRDAGNAAFIIEEHISGIKAAAEKVSGGREIGVKLGEEYYPTRDYGSFALPAGNYASLRVVIGGGGGRNWWCVVFPPLCTAAVSAEEGAESVAGLDLGDTALITEESGGYALKFRALELWGELREKLNSIT